MIKSNQVNIKKNDDGIKNIAGVDNHELQVAVNPNKYRGGNSINL